jgi:transposase-like protein
MHARGVSGRKIKERLEEIYGAGVPPGLISRAADAVLDEAGGWQSRPLEKPHEAVYLGALMIKGRGGVPPPKAAQAA